MTASRGTRRTPTALIWAIAAASAVAAVFADAAPTGNTVGDTFWSALTGAVLARATVDARRWTWFPMAGVAASVANGALALLCGVGALAGVFAAGFFTQRRRWIGAVVGALSAQALLRGYTYGFTGLPTIVAVAACAPMLVSSFRNASAQTRRYAQGAAVVGGVVVGVLSIFTAVSALRAQDRFEEAISFGNQAVAAAEAGDQEIAASLIGAAAEELDSVGTDFNRPWLYPARFVPLLGPHAAVLGDISNAGADVADQAADVLVALDPNAIIVPGGKIDLAALGDLVSPMDSLAQELSEAIDDIDKLDSTWLHPSAKTRVDELADELRSTNETVEVANELVAIAPAMLGANAPQRYLIVFTTPSEARGLGGFAGNWAELVVDRGVLSLENVGRGDDITAALTTGIRLPADVRALYTGFELERTFQNITVVPDFPTVAVLAQAQFEQAFGRPLDGVINIDPAGMGGVVSLSGPVEVNGTTMGPAEVTDFVLRGQYEVFADDNEARLVALEQLTFDVFDQLVNAQLPAPATITDVFRPLIEGDHVRIQSFDNIEAVALSSVGLNGAFPINAGQDLVAVVTQNLGENKIDVFLQRDVTYDVEIDPDSGVISSQLVITLTNNAPADGLPQAIIGNNDQGLPLGTNRTRVQIYSSLAVESASLDGTPVDMISEGELGWLRYRRDLWLDPGQTEELIVRLTGALPVADDYVLHVDHQPLTSPDSVALAVTLRGGKINPANIGLDPQGRAMVSLTSDYDVVVPLGQ